MPGEGQGLSLAQAARITPPVMLSDTERMIDMARLRAWRLGRLRRELAARDVGACVLFSPLSIRYATGLRNCAIFQTHIPAGYLFVPAEGPVVLFDSDPGRHTGAGLETIDECRDDVIPLSYMFAGERLQEWMGRWAAQMADLVARHCGNNRRLAVESAGTRAPLAFEGLGMEVLDATDMIEAARNIKSPDEILCMNHAIAVAEAGMWRMREALAPGLTETQLWSHLWQVNIEHGGDWIECRLLSSGDRTNPWQQEASSRIIRPGELLCFDTDMIGPFGYAADVSRAFFCGPGRPSAYQKELYRRAHEEVMHNIALMTPGTGFREITETSFRQPEEFVAQRYPVLAHGIGMSDEWPAIFYRQDAETLAYDGVLEPGMTICVESYVGAVGGPEGVKLEEQIVITETGNVVLSKFPFEDILLE
jgi:Xaa-Pro aminopeptidase